MDGRRAAGDTETAAMLSRIAARNMLETHIFMRRVAHWLRAAPDPKIA